MRKSFSASKRRLCFSPFARIGPHFQSDVNRRNYWFGVVNGVFYAWAEALTDPTLVLTYFTSLLTSSKFLVGLVALLPFFTFALKYMWKEGHERC